MYGLCREAWRLGGSSSVAGVCGCCIIPHFDSGAAAGAGAWVDGNHRWRYCSAKSGKRGHTKAGSMGLVSRLLCVYVELSHLNMMVLREVIIPK